MKKIFYLLLALVATTSLWASNVITYTATSKLPETRDTSYIGLHINAFDMTISSHTFSNGTGTITFAGEITTIGSWAFAGCSDLTSVTIPNSVTKIGNSAFYQCSGLTSVTIPNSVTTIGNDAFLWCGLTKTNYTGTIADWCKIKFGSEKANPIYYSHNLYINDVEVKDLVIPESVDKIESYAFLWCSLTSVTIPNSVTTIGNDAFLWCGLTKTNYTGTIADWCKIKFGNGTSNPIYYSHNFYINDVEVKDLVIPEGVDTIGNYAFDGCSSLTSVTIPNSVTTIGDDAFWGCSGLTSITIPNSVTTIEYGAFYYCSGLTSVTIPNSVTKIGKNAFCICNGLTKTNYTGTIADWCKIEFGGSDANPMYYSQNFYINDVEIKDLVIPEGVDTIGNYAFDGCSGLTSVTIPNSVTTIGGCAFFDCSGLTSVTIPNSVTKIRKSTFYGCSGLISVTIPNTVTTIGDYAFSNCRGLTSVTIPNSVTTIGSWTFEKCSGLTSITCLATEPPLLGDEVFVNVPRDIPLYVPASSIPAYQVAEEWKEFNIQSLLVDVNPITPDTTQLSWLPVDSASLYKLRIYSEEIEFDTTLMIEADSLSGGIRIPVTSIPQRDRRISLDDIGSVIIIIIEPRSGITTETPFVVTVSTTSKDKIDVGFDLKVLKGKRTIKQESGSFILNAPIADGLEDIPMPCFGVSSGIYDLCGHRYSSNQWNQLPAGIYILRDGEKTSKAMKQ